MSDKALIASTIVGAHNGEESSWVERSYMSMASLLVELRRRCNYSLVLYHTLWHRPKRSRLLLMLIMHRWDDSPAFFLWLPLHGADANRTKSTEAERHAAKGITIDIYKSTNELCRCTLSALTTTSGDARAQRWHPRPGNVEAMPKYVREESHRSSLCHQQAS